MGIREEMLRRQEVRRAQQEAEQEEEGGSLGRVSKLLKAPALERIMNQMEEIGEAFDEQGSDHQTGQTARQG